MTNLNLLGHTLGGFEILSELGRGGMGVVYKARQIVLDRIVALKVLPPELAYDTSYIARFRQEARSAARLEHPSIIAIYEVGQAEVQPSGLPAGAPVGEADVTLSATTYPPLHYIAMKYVQGSTLKDVLAREGPLSLAQSGAILARVGDALDYAHRLGVIHRDIKPSNIMLTDNDQIYLADFGLARGLHDTTDLTKSGMVMGTPEYMSPEQAQGLALTGPATDIYALGMLLYVMLTGAFPFQADTPMAMLAARLVQSPRPPRDVREDIPPAVEEVILRALARDPTERFGSAGEMTAALCEAIGTDPKHYLFHQTPPPFVQVHASPAPPLPPVVRVVESSAFTSTTQQVVPDPVPAPAPAFSPARPVVPYKLIGYAVGVMLFGLLLVIVGVASLSSTNVVVVHEYPPPHNPPLPPRQISRPDPPPPLRSTRTPIQSQEAAALLRQGWDAHKAGDYDSAEEMFQQVLKLAPSDSVRAEALAGRGWVAREEGQLEESRELFEQSLKLDSQQAAAHTGLAWYYLDDNKNADAFNHFSQATQLDPGDGNAFYGLGRAATNLKRHQDAEEAFERALKLDLSSEDRENIHGILNRPKQH